ncbi:RnfABCDGE type electron transport complex subunit D [Cuneatibacter sp. NSJ-177]|uniref:RnfABCDGE type electron transport complex subunit D n=1 Tax=Cuneatibacter sp. NSJ-177 TaxID=2931401 RepID=UPI001FCFA1F5|nr:RnfABCDGE type electron transport complex subunit D [Cuneatibacter sp. NSJ-177]
MSQLFHVSTNPHAVSKDTTSNLMLDVILALIPATAFGIYHFGWYAGVIVLVSVATCVASEYIWEKAMKKDLTVRDYSAVLTGLLLGLNLPPTVPIWLPIIGGAFAIIIVKQLYGGIGQNFMNPALGARCFLILAFAGLMNNFAVDGVSSATPLAALKAGETTNLADMFFGFTPGVIGETSAALILIGGLFLIVRKVITWDIPVIYIGTFAVFMLLFGGHGFDLTYLACEICGGGLMLGAFFMATDYVTSPITPKGRILFAVLLGLLTGIFRTFGNMAEGVSFAIIIGNILVPLIEKVTLPKAFGREGK